MMKRTIVWISASLYLAVALGAIAPVSARKPAGRVRSGHGGQKGQASGRQVFMRNCARCHGGDGKGKKGPPLAGKSLSLDKIQKQVTDGSSKMPSFKKQLSPTQVKAVSAYVQSLGARS